MGKITVKHYLNTKVKPIIYSVDNKEYYPIYTQITYNRKTTQLRSFTTATATTNGFLDIIANKSDIKEVLFLHPYNENLNINNALEKEKNDIIQSIDYILNHKINISGKYDLREVLELFFVYISEIFIENTYTDWVCRKNNHIKETKIYNAFNERFTLYESIKLIKTSINIDLSEYIDINDLELSKYIYYYLKHTKNLTYIDLLRSDYKTEINSIKTIKNKDLMMQFVEFAINDHLLYYQINI